MGALTGPPNTPAAPRNRPPGRAVAVGVTPSQASDPPGCRGYPLGHDPLIVGVPPKAPVHQTAGVPCLASGVPPHYAPDPSRL